MKQIELSTKLLEMEEAIDVIVHDLKRDFANDFQSDSTDNERVNLESDAHYSMVDHLISARINSKWKKSYDNSKSNLDHAAEALGVGTEGIAGESKTLLLINDMKYSKRQNKDGTTTLLTDFVNALNRCDVSKETIDKALKMAEKPKRGNVYYNVSMEE
jgi:hypothetical protein